MNAEMQRTRRLLTSHVERPDFRDTNRVGCLVQASARVTVDDDGQVRTVRIEVNRDEFVACLDEVGSPFRDLVPATKEPHQAMRAAVTRSRKGLTEVDDGRSAGRQRWSRLGVDSNDVLKYALVTEHPDPETGKLNPRRVAVVTCTDTGGTDVEWVDDKFKTNANVAAVDAVFRRYQRERVLLHSDDVRTFVNRVLEACRATGVGGMLHLIPSTTSGKVLAALAGWPLDVAFQTVERALVHAGYQIVLQPIADGEHLQTNVEQGLLAQVARIAREVKHLTAEMESEDGRAVELETFDRRIQMLSDIAGQADLYKELVGMADAHITEALRDAKILARSAQMAMLELV